MMPMSMRNAKSRFAPLHAVMVTLAVAVALSASMSAHADLFGDDQARQAILELRKRVDQIVLSQNRLVDENAQLRRSLLDLQQQIDGLKDDLARARGDNEQLERQVTDLQKQLTAAQQQTAVEQPGADQNGAPAGQGGDAGAPQGANSATATVPAVNRQEQRDFDAALARFRNSDFVAAQTGFGNFAKHYPRSTLAPASLFWLGNAQYATHNYKEAIGNFRSLLAVAPQHDKAPEALLSIASCQIELKDQKSARATLEQLINTYPQSEAASAARDRLAKMK